MDIVDIDRLNQAEREWGQRKDADLAEYWPRAECWDAYMMRANGGVNDGWGYTHWRKMFNPRQLLVLSSILKQLANAEKKGFSASAVESVLCTFSQIVRYHCLFGIYQSQYDKLIPHFSNNNYHPKSNTVEGAMFSPVGAGNFSTLSTRVLVEPVVL